MQNLTVIIPTHNRCELAMQAVKSCLDGSAAMGWKIQVVIVDDGSNDDTTLRIPASFSLKQITSKTWVSENLALLKIENSERGAARNFGATWAIENLLPHWILFLDADDILAPGALQRVLPQLLSSDCVISCQYICWNGASNIDKLALPAIPKEATEQNPLSVSLQFLNSNPLALGCTLIPARIWKQTLGFPESRDLSGSEDWLFLFNLSLIAKVIYLPETLVWYRRHPENTAPEKTENSIRRLQREVESLLPLAFPSKFDYAKAELDFYFSLNIIGAYNSSNKLSQAWRHWRSLLKRRPSLLFRLKMLRFFLSLLKKQFEF